MTEEYEGLLLPYVGFREKQDLPYYRRVAEKQILGMNIIYGNGADYRSATVFFRREQLANDNYLEFIKDAFYAACSQRPTELVPDPKLTSVVNSSISSEQARSEIDHLDRLV